MINPLNLPMNPLAMQLAAMNQAAMPQTGTLEGVPIYLVPTPATTPTLPMAKDLQPGAPTSVSPTPKVDTSKHFHIFIGDLCPEIDNRTLRDAFISYGEISDCKVIRDMTTMKSKGYGFVTYVKKKDAEAAIEGMNGQWLGRRQIRTNWAVRKPQAAQPPKPLVYEEVYAQTGLQNTTVYVGNTNATISESQLKEAFAKFGNIQEIRIFKQQGYCFVRYDSKEAACMAICAVNGNSVNSCAVKCSWGREDGTGRAVSTPALQAAVAASPLTAALASAGNFSYPVSNYNYWTNYYQQYYSNPNLYQQWLMQNLQAASTGQVSAASPGAGFTLPAASPGASFNLPAASPSAAITYLASQ